MRLKQLVLPVVASASLLLVGLAPPALAQLAPMGGNYAARSSDTGFTGGAIGPAGDYATSVPLDLPPAREGLPLSVSIRYGGRRMGAAGVGWDVPLTYIRRDTTLSHHRPSVVGTPGNPAAPQAGERMLLLMDGQRIDLVPRGGGVWVARQGAPQLELRDHGDTWFMYDGLGRTFEFSDALVSDDGQAQPLLGKDLFLLTHITGPLGNVVALTYSLNTPSLPFTPGVPEEKGVSIDLTGVTYNVSPTSSTCAKHAVTLRYSQDNALRSMVMLGDLVLARTQVLQEVDVAATESCPASYVVLRSYLLGYAAPDGDTHQERLGFVTMQGQAGTPEASTTLPVATYAYGSATDNGFLNFDDGTVVVNLPALAHDPFLAETIPDDLVLPDGADTAVSNGFATFQNFVDMTGDGRVDALFVDDDLQLKVALNQPSSILNQPQFGPLQPLFGEGTAPGGALEVRSISGPADEPRNTDQVWRRLLDVNGDGRMDIIDAGAVRGKWVVYLNQADGPHGINWVRKEFSVLDLLQTMEQVGLMQGPRGNGFGGFLPLANRVSGTGKNELFCVKWDGFQWANFPTGFGTLQCPQAVPDPVGEETRTEWELEDVNGDGYPDVVFDASPVGFFVDDNCPFPTDLTDRPVIPGIVVGQVRQCHANRVFGHPTHATGVFAALNTLGMQLQAATAGQPAFAQAVFLHHTGCGVGLWSSNPAGDLQVETCGFADVNGDGLIDYVSGTTAFLGNSGVDLSNATVTLPGSLQVQTNDRAQNCPVRNYTSKTLAALRDMNGDGIPDYVFFNGQVWRVAMGTGIGFTADPSTVNGVFALSEEGETCPPAGSFIGKISATTRGLYDIDGDGLPDVLDAATGKLYRVARNFLPGAPDAGKLVEVANLYGGKTVIRYGSAKDDPSVQYPHQVPFPEIVVTELLTEGLPNAGNDLAPTFYAYGSIDLMYDNFNEMWLPTGYRRAVELRPTTTAGGGVVAKITDTYGVDPVPSSPFDFQDPHAQFLRYAKVGQVKDVTVLSGELRANPSELMEDDLAGDPLRLSSMHFDVDAKAFTETPSDGPFCLDLGAYPFDFDGAQNLAANFCEQRGFETTTAVTSSRGQPLGTPDDMQSRLELTTIDDFGRVTSAKELGDVFRGDDDFCVQTTYAEPSGSDARVLAAVALRETSDCNGHVLARQSFAYDGRTDGKVAAGFVSVTTHSRLDDQGGADGPDLQVKAQPDAAGNAGTITRQRVDTANGTSTIVTQTVQATYDDFGLLPTNVSTSGTGVPARTTTTEYNRLQLLPTRVTDPNGSQVGTSFDGFGRRKLALIGAPGGALGAMSCAVYSGFAVGESGPRRVQRTTFVEPVDPQVACQTSGRTSTVTLDELGRESRTDVNLGADYTDGVTAGRRTYDSLGRVLFEADPFPSSQSFATAYGTTYTFNADGTPASAIRGNGLQPPDATTDLAHEVIRTDFTLSFQGHRREETITQPDGTVRLTEASAIGRVLSRSTFGADGTTERTDFGYDRLGHQAAVIRYLDAAGAGQPVTWTMHHDSLGELRTLDEPGLAQRIRAYDAWGDPVNEHWNDGTDHAVLTSFDALGRPLHREERTGGALDPATVNDYVYDTPSISPLDLDNENVAGRLAAASTPAGSVFFSYDAHGRRSARTFLSNDAADAGQQFIEKRDFHADGSLQALHFRLPDNLNADERIEYTLDSAGRVKVATSVDTLVEPPLIESLFQAAVIDPLGRLRRAQVGSSTTYTAHYADTGRRLLDDLAVSAPPLQTREYVFSPRDVLGRETQRDERVGGTDTLRLSTYDGLGRLATSQGFLNGQMNASSQFQYDPLGNLLSQNDTFTSGANDVALRYGTGGPTPDLDRVCRIEYGKTTVLGSDCNVVYDGAGAIVTQPARNGNRQLTYFPDGLTRTVADDNGNSAQFRYDAFGQLEALDVQSRDSSLERHDRHFGELIERRETIDPSPVIFPDCPACLPPTIGTITVRRVPGPGGLSATRRGAGGPWVFTFGEPRGNRFFTDDTGTLQQAVDYRPFGEATSTGSAETGSTLYSPEQWNGGDALEAFGLAHLGARTYDPVIGRFLSRDPLLTAGDATRSNPYGFAFNDPVNFSDPTGLCGEPEEPPCPLPIPNPLGGGSSGDDSGNHRPPRNPPRPRVSFPTTPNGVYWQVVIASQAGVFMASGDWYDNIGRMFPAHQLAHTLSGKQWVDMVNDVLERALNTGEGQRALDGKINDWNDTCDLIGSCAAGFGDKFYGGPSFATKWARSRLGITSGDANQTAYRRAGYVGRGARLALLRWWEVVNEGLDAASPDGDGTQPDQAQPPAPQDPVQPGPESRDDHWKGADDEWNDPGSTITTNHDGLPPAPPRQKRDDEE